MRNLMPTDATYAKTNKEQDSKEGKGGSNDRVSRLALLQLEVQADPTG